MQKYMKLSEFKFVDKILEHSIVFRLGDKTQLRYIETSDQQILEISLIDILPNTIVEGCSLLSEAINFNSFELSIDEQLNCKFVMENMLLALTDIKFFNTSRKETCQFIVVADDDTKAQYEEAYISAKAYHITRSLNNLPFSLCNSKTLCNEIESIIDNSNVQITVYNQKQIEELNLNGIQAVASGALNEPAIIKMEYKNSPMPKIGLLGKGIMFDSGGYNMKSGDFSSMKTDMAGGSAVIGAVKRVADLGIKTNLVAYVITTENLVNEKAFTPGEVIEYNNGLSVEVGNTDAEGRLILADGLLLLNNEGCDTVIDIATLTGNSATALGKGFAPIYSTNNRITNLFSDLNYTSTDNIWPMPMPSEYNQFIQGDITDLKNSSSSKHAGSITAALFLKNFISEEINWVHIDMGAMSRKKEFGVAVNGFGVRLLSNFIKSYSKDIQD